MKKITFVASILFLISACQNNDNAKYLESEEEVKIITVDSLPDAKWNGEYLKIEDETLKNKPKKQSFGSEMYNMGTVKLSLDEDSITFTSYEKRKTAMNFTTSKIRAFIRSSFSDDLQFFFHKNDIITNGKGKYQADPSGDKKNGVKMMLNVHINDNLEAFVLTSGFVEVVKFDPKTARLTLNIDGVVTSESKDSKKIKGTVNVLFEEAIMVAN